MPLGSAVIVAVGDNEFEIVPPPEIKDQVPTPVVTVVAAITAVVVVAHRV